MRKATTVSTLLLILSCAPAQVAPPAIPSTPPPVPPRPERIAHVTGTVVDVRGEPVRGAHVTVAVGDERCQPSARTFETVTGAAGTFSIEPDIGMGTDESRCIFVTATAGGSTAKADGRALFSAPASGSGTDEVRLRIQLPRPAPLTVAEADRVVDLFQRTLHAHDPALFRELGTYRDGIDALVPGLNDIGSALRGISSAEMVEPYVYRLTGRTGQQITLRIEQDALTRVRSELLDVSPAAHTLLRHLVDVIRKGDADRLAAVAAVDVARAREIIERYRAVPTIEYPDFRLRTVDETAQTLVYAIDDQRVELGYEGGRVFVRSM